MIPLAAVLDNLQQPLSQRTRGKESDLAFVPSPERPYHLTLGMPSFQDSAIIVILALLLFGPKGMAKLARELGKLMGEFRRASADFRFQMDEEFRASEQADQQKKIAAMEAAAPVAPVFQADLPEPEHPHLPRFDEVPEASSENHIDRREDPDSERKPLPIATSGDLNLMPPSTGLPAPRSGRAASLSSVFDSIPQVPEQSPAGSTSEAEEVQNHG